MKTKRKTAMFTLMLLTAVFALTFTSLAFSAEAENVFIGDFTSMNTLEDGFNLYGNGVTADGALTFSQDGAAAVLTKENNYADFTLDVGYEVLGGVNSQGNSELGILLHAGKSSGETADGGLSGMLVGFEYVNNVMQCSVGYYFDGIFEPAGFWDAGWGAGFARRDIRIDVKNGTVAIIINNWQAFVQMDKFFESGSIGFISKGTGLKIDGMTISSAPDSIYPAVTREQWQGNDSINTGKAFEKGQKHSFTMELPVNVKFEALTLYRRADPPGTQTAFIEADGVELGTWNGYGGDVSFPLPLGIAEGRQKLTFTVTAADEKGMYNADYYWLVYTLGGKEYIADSIDVGSAYDEQRHSFICDPEQPSWASFWKRFMSVSVSQIINATPGLPLAKVCTPVVTAPDISLEENETTVDLSKTAAVSETSFNTVIEYYLDGQKLEGSVASPEKGRDHTYTVVVKCLPFNTYSLIGAVGFNDISASGKITFNEKEIIEKNIEEDIIADKIMGGWTAANWGIYAGLDTECRFNDEPNPAVEIKWNLGESYCTDDDTNVEYMFLHMMETYGVNDITYADFAEEFLFHCQNYVWCGNEAARELMRSGVLPPDSGSKNNNPQWSAIDAQIESEIFGMIAPANPDDAYFRSKWWVKSVGDGVAVENAAYYAMLCAESYYESDIKTMLRDVNSRILLLSDGAAYETVNTVNFVLEECDKIKDTRISGDEEWRKVRRAIKDKYYKGNAVDASLNFASVIMSLVLGEGDIKETGRISVLAGWDNDCNAATALNIAGMIKGLDNLPADMLAVSGTGYYNSRRPGLTSDTFENITARIMAQAQTVLISNGGKIENGIWTVLQQTGYKPASQENNLTLERPLTGENTVSDGFRKMYDENLRFGSGIIASAAGDSFEYAFTGSEVRLKGMLTAMGGEVEIFVDGVSYGNRTTKADPASGASGLVKNCYSQTIAYIRGLGEGAHTLKVTLLEDKTCIFESAAAVCSEDEYYESITPDTNLARTYFAKPICSVMTPGPGSGGNPSLSVINDGRYFTDFNNLYQQYDTFLGYSDGKEIPKDFEDYVGYTFSREFTFGKIVFQEGGHWSGGGWFDGGHIRVEVRVGGEWKSVEYNITPAYPAANDLSSFGPFGEIYTFELKTPVKGDGIRLIGTPGGYQKLISCGELEVYA